MNALGRHRFGHDLFDSPAHLIKILVAGVGSELLGEGLEIGRARIVRLVHAMPEAHHALLALELAADKVFDLADIAQLVERMHHRFVRPAVQRPLERAHGGGDGRVHIAERGDRHQRRKRRGVEAMVGVKDQAHVQGLGHRVRGLLAVEHGQERRRDIQRRVRLDEILVLAMPIEVGDQRRRLGEQANPFTGVGLGRLLIRLRVVHRQG